MDHEYIQWRIQWYEKSRYSRAPRASTLLHLVLFSPCHGTRLGAGLSDWKKKKKNSTVFTFPQTRLPPFEWLRKLPFQQGVLVYMSRALISWPKHHGGPLILWLLLQEARSFSYGKWMSARFTHRDGNIAQGMRRRYNSPKIKKRWWQCHGCGDVCQPRIWFYDFPNSAQDPPQR